MGSNWTWRIGKCFQTLQRQGSPGAQWETFPGHLELNMKINNMADWQLPPGGCEKRPFRVHCLGEVCPGMNFTVCSENCTGYSGEHLRLIGTAILEFQRLEVFTKFSDFVMTP
eukprot:scpid76467/ scgid28147/ 